ncbi:MAG: hypothetical protein AAFX09_11335 [Pseudomonadota bacterium]
MIIKTRTRRWTTASLSGASLAALALAGCGAPQETAASQSQTGAMTAPAGEAGEGGFGGEAGEAGGEFGIDPDAAMTDPVIYISAVEVMRAHYIAGLAALDLGDRAAAAEMFSHPISEIYVDLEPVVEARGGASIMEALNQAAVLHFQGADETQLRSAVDAVLAGLDDTLAAAPEPSGSAAAVEAGVLVDLIERAVLQYALVSENEHAWLDGYGLSGAANGRAPTALSLIAEADTEASLAFLRALALLERAYPGAEPPETLGVERSELDAALTAAVAANARLQAG